MSFSSISIYSSVNGNIYSGDIARTINGALEPITTINTSGVPYELARLDMPPGIYNGSGTFTISNPGAGTSAADITDIRVFYVIYDPTTLANLGVKIIFDESGGSLINSGDNIQETFTISIPPNYTNLSYVIQLQTLISFTPGTVNPVSPTAIANNFYCIKLA